MSELLAGRRVVVTGAGSGIGWAIARAAAAQGAVVGAHCLNSQAAVKELVREQPERMRMLCFDVRDPRAMSAAVSEFAAREGGIDGWVNNAGIGGPPGFLVQTSVERLREVVEVNLLGTLLASRAVLPVMIRRQRGVILNVSSIAASRPGPGVAAYAVAKAGVEALTAALAVECAGFGIRVLGLRPGATATGMWEALPESARATTLRRIPLGRPASPEEVASFAVYLLSDEARYVTGSIHTIDGGTLVA